LTKEAYREGKRVGRLNPVITQNQTVLPDIVNQDKMELGHHSIEKRLASNTTQQAFLAKMSSQIRLSPPILHPKAETVMSHYLKYEYTQHNEAVP
jgi:hypothetical protein